MIGMFVFMGAFLHLLAGAIPLILLGGGAMAAYLAMKMKQASSISSGRLKPQKLR